MELILKKIIPSPFGKFLRITHALDSKRAFLLGDSSKMIIVHPDASMEVVWRAGDELDEKWSEYFDHLPDELYREIIRTNNGFDLLDREDYKRIEASELYLSSQMQLSSIYQGHHNVKLAFSGKSISILETHPFVIERAKIRTKGKDPVAASLHPLRDFIVYGTNYGELFEQPFTHTGFDKSRKLDVLSNTCYQIGFSENGGVMIVAGLGFVQFYEYEAAVIPIASLATAVRSFEVVDEYLFLNKGIHGFEVIHNFRQPRRIASIELPFAIDKVVYLKSEQLFLLLSASTAEMALLGWAD